MSRGARQTTLVIHPGALGDLLLAVPALRALRRVCAEDALVMAAQPRVVALLSALGVVDAHVPFDSLDLDALFVGDAEEPAGGLLREARRVVSWFGARDATYARRLPALIPDAIVASSVDTRGGLVWEHLVKTVGGDVADESLRERVTVPRDLAAGGRARLVGAGWDTVVPLVLVHAGASGPHKRWAAEGFAHVVDDVARAHGLRPVLHEGPADAGVSDAVRCLIDTPALELRDPELPILAGILSQVALYVGNDSGISHLAAALGVPSVVLFAPENVAWRPWGASARAVVVGRTPQDDDITAVVAAVRDRLVFRGAS
ncbi:MAG TPA: glycosyltransferase family 9 protein [Solirubrobacteraceae bacterium]